MNSMPKVNKNLRGIVLNDCKNKGFTLIELMIVAVIISIIAGIALPSYQYFVRRANAAQAQQELQKLAEQLERFKSRNFSYRGFNANYLYNGSARFNATTQMISLPIDTSSTAKYSLYIVDASAQSPLLTSASSIGQGWAIKAVSSDIKNFNYLLTSSGVKCKRQATITGFESCGIGQEDW